MPIYTVSLALTDMDLEELIGEFLSRYGADALLHLIPRADLDQWIQDRRRKDRKARAKGARS